MSPIKDPSRYSPDWPRISQERRDAAGQRCEECGVRNGAYGYRRAQEFIPLPADNMADAERLARALPHRPKAIRIVLTVHHMDEDPGNNAPQNLKVLCQAHHLAYHRAGAKAAPQEARQASGQLGLFQEGA